MPSARGEAAVGERGREGCEVGKIDHGGTFGWRDCLAGGRASARGARALPSIRLGGAGPTLSTGHDGTPIRILGIDPGLRRTGWGVIEVEGNRLIYRGLRLGRDQRQAPRSPSGW